MDKVLGLQGDVYSRANVSFWLFIIHSILNEAEYLFKGKQTEDVSWPENVENVQLFPPVCLI